MWNLKQSVLQYSEGQKSHKEEASWKNQLYVSAVQHVLWGFQYPKKSMSGNMQLQVPHLSVSNLVKDIYQWVC